MGKRYALSGGTSLNSASVTLYKETLPKNQQVPDQKTSRFKWGKTVSDVTSRTDISYSAKVLLNAFSEHGKGREIIALSQSALAEAIGGHRGTVQVALAALERVGLIEKSGLPSGHEQIQAYRMLHPALIRSAIKTVETRHKPNLRTCARCQKLGVLRKSTGWCLACTKEVQFKGVVRREVKGTLTEYGIIEKQK